MNDEARIAELIAELQTMTADPTAATLSRLSTLVDELRHETATADAMAGGAALEAARAPLIHRSKGKTQDLLVAITAPGQPEVCLTPQGARRVGRRCSMRSARRPRSTSGSDSARTSMTIQTW